MTWSSGNPNGANGNGSAAPMPTDASPTPPRGRVPLGGRIPLRPPPDRPSEPEPDRAEFDETAPLSRRPGRHGPVVTMIAVLIVVAMLVGAVGTAVLVILSQR